MINPSLYDQLTPGEALNYQKELISKIDITPLKSPVNTVAGADISFNKYSEIIHAGVIVMSYPALKLIEKLTVAAKVSFPYIAGLLAFREILALLEVWDQLKEKPDVLVCDGHGIAHPRRLGIATHFGILTGAVTIGCGKSKLTGTFNEPENEIFKQSPLIDKNEQIGTVLRTKKNCNPVFISPGNKIEISQSVEIIKACIGSTAFLSRLAEHIS